MNPLPIAIIALVGAALALPVDAGHGCNGTITQVETGSETFYLDDRSVKAGEKNQWLYMESNGIDGLQSGGEIDPLQEPSVAEVWDPCQHGDHDRLVFGIWVYP